MAMKFLLGLTFALMLDFGVSAQELVITPLGPKAGDPTEVIKEFKDFIIYKGDTLNRSNPSGQRIGDWIVYRKAFLQRTNGTRTVIDSTNASYVIEMRGRYENGEKIGLWSSFYRDGSIKESVKYD